MLELDESYEVVAMTAQLRPHEHQRRDPAQPSRLGLRALIGSGDRIGALVLPVIVVAVAFNLAFPDAFSVGGPPRWLQVVSVVVLCVGVIVWAWCVVLVLTKVRDGELVTTGPYAIVKHPLYTSVALLVLPWAGFLLDTWVGAVIGLTLYAGSRMFAPHEEAAMADRFGPQWEAYRARVKVPWL
jgi:protein-S-isoprenylcysteine O-methyltransferase Ste14